MTRAERARSRLDWAQAQLAECRLCPRDCRVDRTSGETGWCGADDRAQVFMEFVHYGEEAPLAPSHTFYLTGCNLRCVFCHTAPDRQGRGQALTGERLRALVERGRREGARNVNFLGGEPTVSLPALLRLFAEVRDLPPLVWNSNLYCTADALAALEAGRIQAVLTDALTAAGAVKEGKSVELSGTPLFSAPVTFAVRKDQSDLLRVSNALIARLRKSGWLTSASKAWFSGLDLTRPVGTASPSPTP